VVDGALAALVRRALEEDVGAGDVTTLATVPARSKARALITQKAPGAVFGLDAVRATFAELDPDVQVNQLVQEGEWWWPAARSTTAWGCMTRC
jgi:nicotinate-nucleotide pyrophosphorylase (carboxylating)